MKQNGSFVHPYIPNSVPEIKARMLEEIGAGSVEELYADIPEGLRFKGRMNLPEPLLSELELRRHLEGILAKNRSCEEFVSFLGGGCCRHYVPAVCDEVNRRSEFLTAYAGDPYEDHGRFQALFEYQSLMAELLDVEVVNVPTYDWCQAAGTSLRMAERITGRSEVLVADTIAPERRSFIDSYCRPKVKVKPVGHEPGTGLLDLQDLRLKISGSTAAVYFENPTYFGCLESRGREIAEMAHERGALCVVGADPITMGVIKPPSNYGADITCGDIQSLGLHIYFGGATGGFVATRDEKRFVMEYPFRLFGIARTEVEGEYGFGDVAYDRTSFGVREKGKEFVGTAAALWGITAAVYLSLMGPRGMFELGRHILQKSQYTMRRLSGLRGVTAPRFGAAHFKEFVVDFDATGRSVAEVNKALLNKGIFGGHDLSGAFPELGQNALYCVTEMHTKADIDGLVEALREIVG
jgi:glycine dehydrogenase subunit 1